jgi:hypothetical protein
MAKKKNTGRGRKRPKPQGGGGSNENSCPHAARRRREAAVAKASFEKWEADMLAASEARMASDKIKERAARRRAELTRYLSHSIATARECSREAAELARCRQKQRQRVRIIAETAAASARQRQVEASRRRVLSEIKGGRRALKPTSVPSRVSQEYARAFLLLQIRRWPKLKPTDHPSTSSEVKRTTEKKRTREAQRLAAQSFLSTSNIVEHKRGEQSISIVGREMTEDASKSRVLAKEIATVEESIEEMVCRMEREMEEELETLFPSAAATSIAAASAPSTNTAAAMVAEQRVPEAEELEELKTQNKFFDSSYLPPATTTAAATEAPVATAEPIGLGKNITIPTEFPALPPGIKTQTPPSIEPSEKPPPNIDKRKEAYRYQGCRQHRTVSRKGVLDIVYLASGRGPECRSRYRYGAEARVREVYPWLARQ